MLTCKKLKKLNITEYLDGFLAIRIDKEEKSTTKINTNPNSKNPFENREVEEKAKYGRKV